MTAHAERIQTVNPFYKIFLMFGVIFAAIWLILDYVQGDGLSD